MVGWPGRVVMVSDQDLGVLVQTLVASAEAPAVVILGPRDGTALVVYQ